MFRSPESNFDIVASSFLEMTRPPKYGRREVGRFETANRRRAYFPCGCCISRPPDAGIASACTRVFGHKKPTGLTEVGTAVRGVSTLLDLKGAPGERWLSTAIALNF